MAGEIEIGASSGQVLYAVVRSAAGRPWNTATLAFEDFTGANYANYAIPLTEQGVSGYYVGDMPTNAAVVRDLYAVVARVQAGGAPAMGDTLAGSGQLAWNGTAQQSIANLLLDGAGDVTLTAAEHTAISGTDVPAALAPLLAAQGVTNAAMVTVLSDLNSLLTSLATDLGNETTLATAIAAIKAQTDLLTFSGGNVQSVQQGVVQLDPAQSWLGGTPVRGTTKDFIRIMRAWAHGKSDASTDRLTRHFYDFDDTTVLFDNIYDNLAAPTTRNSAGTP